MPNFKEFVSRKQREASKQLKIIKKVLEKEGLTVDNFLDDDDPYIFVHSTNSNLSFDGVRLYKIGEAFAYRVQKEKDTHPFGKAYKLDIEEMFNDLVSEDGDEEKAGKESMKALGEELRMFFKKSMDAERDIRVGDILDDDEQGENGVLMRPSGLDYSTMITNKR